MFAGDRINRTEDRSVLLGALRMPKGERLEVDGVDVVAQVHAVLDRMAAFADRVRGGQWTGHSGKRIRNVVSIGIGGSDLGPVMACEALRDFSERDMRFAFVSNVDGRPEEHTSELQSLMRNSYAVFCLTKKNKHESPS